MKKVVLFSLFASILLFSACEKTPDDLMVGHWKLEKSSYTAQNNSNVIEETPAFEKWYDKNGTGSSVYLETNAKQTFQWYLSEDYTQITQSSGGFSFSYQVEELTKDRAVFSKPATLDASGTVYTYREEFSKIGK